MTEDQYLCRQEIMDRLSQFLSDVPNIKDAVIWDYLQVVEVALVQALSPDGSEIEYYTALIEEASPEAYKLHEYIVHCMNADSFFDNLLIEIRTEW